MRVDRKSSIAGRDRVKTGAFENCFGDYILLTLASKLFSIGNQTVLSSIWSEFFKKLKLHEPLRRVQFRFLKNSQVQINSKLNEKNCMITY